VAIIYGVFEIKAGRLFPAVPVLTTGKLFNNVAGGKPEELLQSKVGSSGRDRHFASGSLANISTAP
jgi:hypothetical protein